MAPLFNPAPHPLIQKIKGLWEWLGRTPSDTPTQEETLDSEQEIDSNQPSNLNLENPSPHFLPPTLTPLAGDTYQWLKHTQESYQLELIQNGQRLGNDLSLIPHPDSLKHSTFHNRSLGCESILTINKGYVIGHYGAVMTPDWVLLGDQNVDERGLSHFVSEKSKSFIEHYQQHQLPVLCLPKSVIVLTHMWPEVYGHFLIESITKLSLLEIVAKEFDAVIVPSKLPSCGLEVLNQLGIQEEKLIRIEENEIIQVESLIILSWPSFFPFADPTTLNWVQKKFLPHPHSQQAKGHKLVYWPRFDRRLQNEAQVIDLLTQWGIECIDHRNMSLREQIDILMETSVLICFHGSGLTNLIFLPPQAVVIEIQQRQTSQTLFKTMAKACHYRFIELKSEIENDEDWEKSPPSHYMPSILPPKRLETFLRHHMDLFSTTLSKEKTLNVIKNWIHSSNKPLPTLSIKNCFSKNNHISFHPNQLMACEKENTWPSQNQTKCYKMLEKNIESLEPLIKQNREFQYLLTIKNGTILGNEGVFLTANAQFIHDFPTYHLKRLNKWFQQSAQPFLTQAFQEEEQRVHYLSGKILCLTGLYSNAYWHVLVEYLPRILIAEKCSVAFDGIAISDKAKNNIESLIKPLGITLEKVHFLETNHLYFVDELLVPSVTAKDTLINTEVFQWLREKYLSKENMICKPFRKIFWSRHQEDKRLLNAEEVKAYLAGQDFEIYDDVTRPIEEQARIFAESSVVVFPHGSGGTNLIFCQPNTQVIEIRNHYQCYYLPEMYQTLSTTLGLSYSAVFTQKVSQYHDWGESQFDHGLLHLDDLIQKLGELNIIPKPCEEEDSYSKEKTITGFKSDTFRCLTMKELFTNKKPDDFGPYALNAKNKLTACEKGTSWPPQNQSECIQNLEKNIDVLDPLLKEGREFQYLLTLQNGWILGDQGVFLTANYEFIYDYPTYFLNRLNQWVEESGKRLLANSFQQEEQFIQFLSGRILCLTGVYSNVYWHLFAEFLPRVLIAEKCSVTFDGIAISEKARRNIQSLIKPLGIPMEKVHFIQPDQLYFVEELLVPSVTSNNTPSNTEVFQWIQEKYLPKESLRCKPFRKIFWARQKNSKRLLNADEISSWLAKQGFEIYEDVLRPIEEQARIFAEASVVIFPHGSGGTNLIFCQPHCKVIEIKTQFQPDYTFNLYKNLCHTLSLDHHCVLAETIFQRFESKSSQHDHGYLHLEALIQTLNTLEIE